MTGFFSIAVVFLAITFSPAFSGEKSARITPENESASSAASEESKVADNTVKTQEKPETKGAGIDNQEENDFEESALPYVSFQAYSLKKNESLRNALKSMGISPDEIQSLIKANSAIGSNGKNFAGSTVLIETNQLTGNVTKLTFPLNDNKIATIERLPTGGYAVNEAPIHYETRLVLSKGRIETSFYDAARDRDLDPDIIKELADVFAWELDFSTELKRGDSFSILYEEKFLDGEFHHYGQVLASEIKTRRQGNRAFYFKDRSGESGYYDDKGRSLRKSFLKSPVKYKMISSDFQKSRFHPILRIWRPHLGVDLAAPYGTAVMAAGDGEIAFAGWHGDDGRHVRIKHTNTYDSSYSHLSSIAPGMRAGVKVKQGQVIGQVGSSGLSTGPHLHYAFWKNGIYLNPFSIRIPPGKVLDTREVESFNKVRLDRLAKLNDTGLEKEAAAKVAKNLKDAGAKAPKN